MRVNNVRNAWKIDHPDSENIRSFYDSSLWESKKLTDPDRIKALICAGVSYTSVVCVLIGSETWERRWVRYEIARSVIDEKGLLGVHLNGLAHHQRQAPDEKGYNPLHLMGLGCKPNGKVYLCEKKNTEGGWKWLWYEDYTQSVPLPKYTPKPGEDVVALSEHVYEYDFVKQQGHKNIGEWVDLAAQRAGR